jgi:protein SCO1
MVVDQHNQTVTVSHDSIPDFMDAMTMPFHVQTLAPLAGLHPGDSIRFTLVVDKSSSWIEDIHVVEFDSAERDPSLASRLKLLGSVTGKTAALPLGAGQSVPDFTLTDQAGARVTLSQFVGKVVAINFAYTRCPLPDYCFRLANNFGLLRKRFDNNPDLILITVSFDPVNDQPDVLARYARIWKADPRTWHFLTGPVADVQRLCEVFGVGAWQDDGLLTHSLHTAVIDRQGKLVANIEGNRYTPRQLGDLVSAVLQH